MIFCHSIEPIQRKIFIFLMFKTSGWSKKKWRLHITIYSNIINYLKTRLRSFLKCWKSSYHSKLVTMRKHTSNKTFQGYIFLFVIQFERWQMFRFSSCHRNVFVSFSIFEFRSLSIDFIAEWSLLYFKTILSIEDNLKKYRLHFY